MASGHGVEVGVDGDGQPFDRVRDRGDRLGELVKLGRRPRDAELEEQLLLAGEVAVDQTDRHARLGGDRRDAGASEAAGDKGAAPTFEDALAHGLGMGRGSPGHRISFAEGSFILGLDSRPVPRQYSK